MRVWKHLREHNITRKFSEVLMTQSRYLLILYQRYPEYDIPIRNGRLYYARIQPWFIITEILWLDEKMEEFRDNEKARIIAFQEDPIDYLEDYFGGRLI